MKEERFEDGLQLIQKFETQWNGELFEIYFQSIEKEIPVIDRAMLKELGDGLIQLSKAFFLAMSSDRDALASFDDGIVHLRLGVEKVIEMLKSLGIPSDLNASIRQELNAFNPFYRGLLEFSLGDKAEAAAHLREFHALYMENSDLESEELFEHLLTLRIIEKHVGEEILPAPTTVDKKDPGALLMAGRFEEALAIIDRCVLSDIYMPSLPLFYILKGEPGLAKEEALKSGDLVDYALVLLLLRGIEKNS